MAKTCPSCGYNPIGPFIDNCPMCAEPVRYVRSGGAGPARAAHLTPLQRWVLGGLLVALLIVGGRWALVGGRRAQALNEAQQAVERAKAAAEADRQARTVMVSAARLVRECQNDPAADRKFKGKYLELFGVVERAGRDRDDVPFVILNGDDERATLKIECFFDAADEEDEGQIDRLRKGQMISVRGEYSGRISHLQIRDCILVK